MKKIFGVLSLIAIMTVAFTSQAVASDNDNVNTEYVSALGSPDVVAVEVPTFDGVFNVYTEPVSYDFQSADVTVNYTDEGESLAEAVPIVTGDFDTNFNFNNEPDVNTEPDLILSDATSYLNTDNIGYASPEIVKDIATNVGKFTGTYIKN